MNDVMNLFLGALAKLPAWPMSILLTLIITWLDIEGVNAIPSVWEDGSFHASKFFYILLIVVSAFLLHTADAWYLRQIGVVDPLTFTLLWVGGLVLIRPILAGQIWNLPPIGQATAVVGIVAILATAYISATTPASAKQNKTATPAAAVITSDMNTPSGV